ncbi:MAG TPA: UbiA family prenyltransferase [Reyranellaceae bacterium]|nr:UbiA family prenyltransferase [Reyranellaceae bacterium]
MAEQTMTAPSLLRAWVKALRPHQWAKNALVFAPLALAGIEATLADIERALAGFVALSLVSSVGYIVNDLLDMQADRAHPVKRNRPFAAGTLPVWVGIITVPVLLLIAGVIAFYLPPLFGRALAVYFAGTLLYSFIFKRMPPFDLVIIGGLFTVRVLAGMAFVPPPISLWFLTFAMFMFIGLAAVKRYAELLRLSRESSGLAKLDRGYDTSNIGFVMALGVGCGIAAVMIFIMYLMLDRFPARIYVNPVALWFMAPVLLAWLMRIWLLASRGEMDEDPIAFALRDLQSWTLGGICAVLIYLAW